MSTVEGETQADWFLSTGRLRFRHITEHDLDYLVQLDTDPEVMRFITDGKPRTLAETQLGLARVISIYIERPGMGTWAAFLKNGGDFVGWFTIKPLPNTPDIEVGYRLVRRAWGNGYATEGTRALLEYGFAVLGLPEIVAIARPDNAASRRVLEKSGLSLVDERVNPHGASHGQVCYYVMKRPGTIQFDNEKTHDVC